MFTFTASSGRPNVSATTMPMHVRVPVPRSWLPQERLDAAVGMDLHACSVEAWPPPPQV